MSSSGGQVTEDPTPADEPAAAAVASAGRKRAAVELIAGREAELRRAAARFSLCPEDAEDAYQRALEILLTKAPSDRPRELIRWTKTVIKHEALAIRQTRERMLSAPSPSSASRGEPDPVDLVALIPASEDGPGERVEDREDVARSREALRALRPAELRALTLLAAGYSYAEIGEATGFRYRRVNRCIAEGRERFRQLVSSSEDGSRCEEMGPLLSAFCDGEASAEQARAVRDHLRACAGCRATMRCYRATPATVAALAPALPLSRSLLERAQDLLGEIHSRLPGAGGAVDGGLAQVATAGGTGGAGMAGIAKVLAICVGTVGGGAACVATGIAPSPAELAPEHAKQPRIERVAPGAIERVAPPAAEPEPAPSPEPVRREPPPPDPEPEPEPEAEAVEPAVGDGEAGAVEYAPPAAEAAPPAASADPPAASSGSAAGEFGP